MRNLTTLCLSFTLGTALTLAGCGSKEATPTPASGSADVIDKSASPEQRLAELAKDGPVFLYFTKETCGSNPEAVPLVQAIYKPYEGKVKMVAVVNAPASAYDGWKQQYGLTMPGLADEDMALVKHFGFDQSQHIVMVKKGGKAREIEGGYGRPALEALNKELAAAAGAEEAKVDLSAAPGGAKFG